MSDERRLDEYGFEDATTEGPLSGAVAGDVGLIAKGGVLQMSGQAIHAILSFAFTATAVRILGTAGFGIYRQITQVLMIAAQVSHGGFNFAAMNFIARGRASGDPRAVKGAVRVALIGTGFSSAIVFISLLAGADLLARAFSSAGETRVQLASLFRLGSPYVVLAAYMSVLCYFTIGYKTVVPSVIAANFVQPLARFVLGVAALMAGFELVGATAAFSLAMGVGLLAALILYRKMLSPEERGATPHADVRGMVRFGTLQAGVHLLDLQTLGLGIILLGLTNTDSQVGLFAVALSLQGPGQLIHLSISNIWNPVISDLFGRGDHARLESLTRTVNRWIGTFSFPVFTLLMIKGDLFFALLTGQHEPTAGSVIALLALGSLAYTSTGAIAQVVSMTGRPGINFANSVLAALTYASLGIVFSREHGALGIAVVDAAVLTSVALARIIEVIVVTRVNPFGPTIFKPILATLAGALLLLVSDVVGPVGIAFELVAIVMAGLVYLAVLRKAGIDPEERFVIERIRRRVPNLLPRR